jgi:hypothetical protein
MSIITLKYECDFSFQLYCCLYYIFTFFIISYYTFNMLNVNLTSMNKVIIFITQEALICGYTQQAMPKT